jgi:hypothetical protein
VRADSAEHEHHQRHGDRGDDEDEDEDGDDLSRHQSTKYLRLNSVASRYAVHPRSVPRMVKDKRIPPPAFYNGRFPLWDLDQLDENDRRAAKAFARRISDTATSQKSV